MVSLDASTPQLRAVKNWLDAFASLDIKNVEPLLSKNFQYHPFPETADIPKEAKEKYTERFGGVLSAASKLEVRVQHRRTTLMLGLISPPLVHLSRSD